MSVEVILTFPDGSKKPFPGMTTGFEVAEGISKSLAKKAVAYAIDGQLRDLSEPLAADGQIEIVTRDDPRPGDRKWLLLRFRQE